MKVIKDGTKNIEITCEHCNSTLEYEQEDIKFQVMEIILDLLEEWKD